MRMINNLVYHRPDTISSEKNKKREFAGKMTNSPLYTHNDNQNFNVATCGLWSERKPAGPLASLGI